MLISIIKKIFYVSASVTKKKKEDLLRGLVRWLNSKKIQQKNRIYIFFR